METGKTMVKESWINGKYAFPFAKGAVGFIFVEKGQIKAWTLDKFRLRSQVSITGPLVLW